MVPTPHKGEGKTPNKTRKSAETMLPTKYVAYLKEVKVKPEVASGIKWLKGHTSISYNCKDEYLACISYNESFILHNLVSATRAIELKDPHA